MSQAWEDERVRGTELLLLLALCDFANDEGVCFPSVNRLAKRCRVEKRAVQRHITTLIGKGIVRRHLNQSQYATNIYVVSLGGVKKDTGVKATIPAVSPQTPEPSVEPSKDKEDQWFKAYCELMKKLKLNIPRTLSDTRRKALRCRMRDDRNENQILDEIENSDFLQGKKSDWVISLDWVLIKRNWIRTLERTYRNRKEKNNDHSKTWWHNATN